MATMANGRMSSDSDLGPNCLQRVSEDTKMAASEDRVKQNDCKRRFR